MSPALVILAGGLGSRFGGLKQLAPVGPGGEAFMDYSIRHARSAGLAHVVVVVRSEIEQPVADHLREVHGGDADIELVCQDRYGPPRSKPWGTAHAVLAAAERVDGPIVVINADDYYGPGSYRVVAKALAGASPHRGVVVTFGVGRTLPPHGEVSRAVCEVIDGRLSRIVEHLDVRRDGDGRIRSAGVELAEDTPVSMNMWGFEPSFVAGLAQQWPVFLAANREDPRAELALPTAVAGLIATGDYVVDVVETNEAWIGITHPDDVAQARDWLASRGASV